MDESVSKRARVRATRGRLVGLGPACLVLAIAAFLLLPTAQANLHSLAEVNGWLLAVAQSSTVDEIASGPLASVKAGSQLDITGDVVALGAGSPAQTEVDGRTGSGDTPLADGSVVTVRHGDNLLEGLVEKTESINFKTTVEGSGVVVRLARTGIPGKKTIYQGVSSRKQAAVFTITEPQDAVLQRSATAKSGQKLAALTFDDGPGKWTQGVLDALATKHVPATFFVLGSSAAGNKDLIQKIRASGHEVENHSWSHPILTRLTADQVRSEISRTSAVIGGSHFLRPPYGTYNASVASIAGSMGYRLVLWTVDTLDWKNRDVGSILSLVKAETKPGAIILMHDGGADRSQTIAAIPKIVDWLLQNGYSLTTVETLL